MKTDDSRQRDRMFIKLFFKSSPTEMTEEEVTYFRDHPELIDEVTAPVNVHKLFLWGGALLGTLFVGLSKVFEIGVALIGAAVTAYILGILLNQQQKNAAHWRAEIRGRIKLL